MIRQQSSTSLLFSLFYQQEQTSPYKLCLTSSSLYRQLRSCFSMAQLSSWADCAVSNRCCSNSLSRRLRVSTRAAMSTSSRCSSSRPASHPASSSSCLNSRSSNALKTEAFLYFNNISKLWAFVNAVMNLLAI
jgi:hypothetical protein